MGPHPGPEPRRLQMTKLVKGYGSAKSELGHDGLRLIGANVCNRRRRERAVFARS